MHRPITPLIVAPILFGARPVQSNKASRLDAIGMSNQGLAVPMQTPERHIPRMHNFGA